MAEYEEGAGIGVTAPDAFTSLSALLCPPPIIVALASNPTAPANPAIIAFVSRSSASS